MSPRNKSQYRAATALSLPCGAVRYPSEYGPSRVLDAYAELAREREREAYVSQRYGGVLAYDPAGRTRPETTTTKTPGIWEGVVIENTTRKIGRGERRRRAARQKLGMNNL